MKTKLSVIESIKLVIHSKYIGRIALLIICYGLLINIVEGPWKAKIKELHPNTIDYVNFMGRFNIWMGISCVTFMIIGSNILRRLGWLISALLTPIMLSITGLMFFIFIIFIEEIGACFGDFNLLYAAIIVGAIQNILSKSSKYSLFDSTKEMAYIPLSLELRTKGKAAVEVIGTKFGKSLGAFIQSLIFIIIPTATFDSIIIYLLVTFIVMMSLWIWNVIKLNKEYIELCK
ncbi:TLC ATP/ADP transporter family protein [Rickettsia amblyommatis str. Ac/Pa]|uniref:ADP,ATP carrier protein n=2 Tax=Rickettsia amblyommatis TaxID=33989 RepID=A0A0F3N3Z3_RICAM|nr:TLC ATP/ADP transporter family protein [Rickettsia amblyommatis str. Ac/Pa]